MSNKLICDLKDFLDLRNHNNKYMVIAEDFKYTSPNESYFIGKDIIKLRHSLYKFCNWSGALCTVIFVRPIMNLSIF